MILTHKLARHTNTFELEDNTNHAGEGVGKGRLAIPSIVYHGQETPACHNDDAQMVEFLGNGVNLGRVVANRVVGGAQDQAEESAEKPGSKGCRVLPGEGRITR